jgi:hypothetical protein
MQLQQVNSLKFVERFKQLTSVPPTGKRYLSMLFHG